MENFFNDLRYSCRQMLRAPGFTIAILLCLALGIGANSATFSLTQAILFPPTAFKAPERMVRLFIENSSGLKFGSFSYPDYKDLRDRATAFSSLATDTPTPLHINIDGRNDRFWGSLVSANYFDTLGVEIRQGRGFRPEEDSHPGAQPVVVLSHGFWERHFASNPNVLGTTLSLNGSPFTIIGIAPQDFYGSSVGFRYELWVPMMMYTVVNPEHKIEARDEYWLGAVIGRLKPGVTLKQANDQVAAVMKQLRETYPDINLGKTVALFPEETSSLHPMVRGATIGFFGLMFVVVDLVLLLACSNVAGLLLARSLARRREIAVRLALGVPRDRLIRQLLTESTVLSVSAGIVGLLLSFALVRAIQSFRPPIDMPLAIEPRLDAGVLAFTFVIAVVTGILFGLAPALQSTRVDLVTSLKEISPTGDGRGWFRKALVVAQVGLSTILLIGASLALESFHNAHRIHLGFQTDHRLIASIDLGLQGYSEANGRQLIRSLTERLKALPGVTEVSVASTLPLSLSRPQVFMLPQGYEVPEGKSRPIAGYDLVGPDYFKAMGIALLQGRGFGSIDTVDSAPVAISNQSFARTYWPRESAIGKKVRAFGEDYQIVGVVEDGKYFSLGEDPTPYLYMPFERKYRGNPTFVVHTLSNPSTLVEPIRREVVSLDPKLSVYNLKTLDAQLSFALLPAELSAIFLTAFAVLALFLSSVGLFAIVSYWVSQKARDLSIRQAVGASSGQIVKLVLRQGLALAVIGLAIGLAIGIGLSQLAAKVLYGMRVGNPVPFLLATAVLLVVVVTASLLPALKALRVDVVQALRGE